MCTARHVDEIWIGSWGRTPEEDLTRVESALALIKQHSPLDYARVARELERIWVSFSLHGLGEYNHSLKACILDERYLANPATTAGRIASTIVHETTHARLERCGIRYKEELRTRIEAICFRRELAFAVRLPDSAELQQELARYLEWYPANPDWFSDARFRERRAAGEMEALRYLHAPEWIVRAMPMQKSIIDRARRRSPIAAWAISVPFVIVFGLCYAFAVFLDPKDSKSEPARIERAGSLLCIVTLRITGAPRQHSSTIGIDALTGVDGGRRNISAPPNTVRPSRARAHRPDGRECATEMPSPSGDPGQARRAPRRLQAESSSGYRPR